MKKYIINLKRSSFVKNVLVMITGAAGAQMIAMLFSPIVTRMYGPEAFGIMGAFTSLVNIILPVAALTYPVAIVLPKKDKEAKSIIKLSIIISFIIALVVLVVLFLSKESLIKIFNLHEISMFIYLIPLVIILGASSQTLEQWSIRTKQFKINAKVNFFQSLIINSSKIGIGLFYPLAIILVLLQTMTYGLKSIMLFLFLKTSTKKYNAIEDKNKESIIVLARKYHEFPLYRAPERIFSSLTTSLPVLMLSMLFGPASAGFYSIGRTVLSMPSRLIGQAIGDVFYPRITEAANNNERLDKLIKKSTAALIAIGFIPYGLIMIFGPYLFEFVFGEGWKVAGEYARWIALVSYSTLFNKPSIKSMPVLAAQRFLLLFTMLRLTLQVLGLVLGFYIYNNDILAVKNFGIIGFVSNVLFIIYTIKLAKQFNQR